MKHPTSKKVYKVIEAFEKILPMIKRKNHLDMLVCDVNYSWSYPCGTIHCHGGWYAIASGLHLVGKVFYLAGANQMAKDFGFDNYNELQDWAKKNPEIWGNENGVDMFVIYGAQAFYHPTKRPKGAETLKDIVDHWREVGERLEKLENPYINITKELAIIPIEETSDIINQKELSA